ncbi:hypothetical protein OG196_01355 [Kitasatospora purpeofusca]|uniref:hypothetical protein n=1 Tax=Kitasatospora purpeofusca TaxID=67352 RepID=UPI002E0FBCA4|nr:hypothetical protein OG715_00820 [Kitasatospora purpeofusca]WSR37843.1 hypothetical protein OG196_01355 [Kitasatospora purpeofusca]
MTSTTSTTLLPPVMVGRPSTSAEAGRTIYFYGWEDPANSRISTDNPDVLKVIPGADHGSWTSTPCAEGIKPGTACVTITPSPADPDQCVLTTRITVTT